MSGTPGFTNYAFDRVSVVVGPVIIDGFAEGEGVSIQRDAPAFTKYVGADGKVCRARMTNKCAKVTIRLGQFSATNDQLSALYNAGLLTPNGEDVVPFALIDRSGRTVFESAYCWLAELPEITFGSEVGVREWVLDTADLDGLLAGN